MQSEGDYNSQNGSALAHRDYLPVDGFSLLMYVSSLCNRSVIFNTHEIIHEVIHEVIFKIICHFELATFLSMSCTYDICTTSVLYVRYVCMILQLDLREISFLKGIGILSFTYK